MSMRTVLARAVALSVVLMLASPYAAMGKSRGTGGAITYDHSREPSQRTRRGGITHLARLWPCRMNCCMFTFDGTPISLGHHALGGDSTLRPSQELKRTFTSPLTHPREIIVVCLLHIQQHYGIFLHLMMLPSGVTCLRHIPPCDR